MAYGPTRQQGRRPVHYPEPGTNRPGTTPKPGTNCPCAVWYSCPGTTTYNLGGLRLGYKPPIH
eukprot:3202661-Rhodomonas_salina.2